MNPVSRLIIRAIGPYPAIELKGRLRRLPATVAQRRLERTEVRRLLGERIPPARVATIIPTFRREALLDEAVRSALAQDVEDHVVVVVDDGGGELSTIRHPQLFQVTLAGNSGVVGVVRNIGIGITSSPFCAFLDDDNQWLPGHLRAHLAALAGGAAMSYSGLERVDQEGSLIETVSVPFDRRASRSSNHIDASCVVLRRGPWAYFSRVPRPYGTATREDWEIVRRVSRRHEIVHVPGATVRYLVHDGTYYSER